MKIKRSFIIGCMAVLATTGISSCKGRTTKNVVPTGDTIEVVINTPDIPTDSTASNPS